MATQVKAKYWNGRMINKEYTVKKGPNVDFGALYEAIELLRQQGFSAGWLDGDNPIGFAAGNVGPQKWHTLPKEEKTELDGVLLSTNFRTSDVKIIFFGNEQ